MGLDALEILLLNCLEVGISIVSWHPDNIRKMQWIFVNDARCRLSGFTRDEILARTPLARATRESRAQIKITKEEMEKHGHFSCESTLLHRSNKAIPVIMVTAKGEESDIILGLELGADDYVTKPFKPKELIARVRAVLRRSRGAADVPPTDRLALHDLVINPRRREVTHEGRSIELTFTEFEILLFLARHPGWVFTRYQIVDAVRGESYPVTDRSVDVQIVGLRKKLGDAGCLIETVRGIGYRFRDVN